MKIFLLTFLLSLILANGQEWNNISFNNEDFKRIRQIDDATLFIGSKSTIYKSSDGGSTWLEIFHIESSNGIRDFHFIDESIGYVLYYEDSTRKLAKTTDGANSWAQKNSANGEAIYFTNELNGYSFESSFLHYHTNDGADSWEDSYENAPSSAVGDIHFPNESTGYMVGWYPGGIVKTTDSGENWVKIYGPEELLDVYFTDSNTGYLVGFRNSIFKTSDGAETFTTITNEPLEFYDAYKSISCVDENNCWMIKSNYFDTTDYYSDINYLQNGNSITNQFSEQNTILIDINCSLNTCYAVGENGIILKLEHNLSLVETPKNSDLILYPNPTNEWVYVKNSINYLITEIELYNSSGQLLETKQSF